MYTIIVDDDELAVSMLERQLEKIVTVKLAGTFADSESALNYAKNNRLDLAILDINIGDGQMNGILLGDELLRLHPQIMLIYITALEEFALQAVKQHAADYLLKPCRQEELEVAIDRARRLSKRTKRIYARTFGHFDLFVDDRPIMFKSAKAKELLALLIDRQGGTVTTDQIIGTLWEDRPNDAATQNLCSKVGKKLEQELRDCDAEDMLVSVRGMRHVDTEEFDCDLYDLLAGKQEAIQTYIGEYLLDYSWAESRMVMLSKFARESMIRQKS